MRFVENFVREFPKAFIIGSIGLVLTLATVLYSVIKKVI